MNRILSLAIMLALLATALTACAEDVPTPDIPFPTARAVTRAPSTAAAQSTAAPARTPETTDAATQAVRSALQAKDASGLANLLIDSIFLAQGPNGDVGDTLSREDAIKWLNTRWGANRQVIASDFVEHTVMLEIDTSGWARVAPLQTGNVIFHLHRYNAQGQSDGLLGDWRIDTIIYQ